MTNTINTLNFRKTAMAIPDRIASDTKGCLEHAAREHPEVLTNISMLHDAWIALGFDTNDLPSLMLSHYLDSLTTD